MMLVSSFKKIRKPKTITSTNTIYINKYIQRDVKEERSDMTKFEIHSSIRCYFNETRNQGYEVKSTK